MSPPSSFVVHAACKQACSTIRKFIQCRRANALVEYGVFAALITGVIVVGSKAFSTNSNGSTQEIIDAFNDGLNGAGSSSKDETNSD